MAYSKEVIIDVPGTSRAKLKKYFLEELQSNQEQLEKFTLELTSNPAYHARWADKMFMFAAKIEVAHQAVELLNHRRNAADIREQLQENIVNAARYMYNKSTSPSSNYMSECSMSARCEALERFQYIDDLDKVKLPK
jgi:hypothetical protein